MDQQNQVKPKGFSRPGKPVQTTEVVQAVVDKVLPVEKKQVSNNQTTKPKRTFTQNHVGYVSRSTSGFLILKVEQDMVLKAGDAVIFNTPQEVLDSKYNAGFLKDGSGNVVSEERLEEMKSKVPEWKLYEAAKMKPKV